MLVHLVEAGQHGAEIVRPDGEHGREPDGRIHRVAPADPVPEAEHVGRVDAELRHLLRHWSRRRRNAWPWRPASPSRPASSQSRAVCALVIVSSVVKVLEETMNSVSAGSRSLHRLGEIRAVDIGDEAEGHAPLAVVPERFVGHHRAEIGAADADVDHVADALAGVALPGAAAHAIGEVRHLVEHGMDLGHDILAVDAGWKRRAARAGRREARRASP